MDRATHRRKVANFINTVLLFSIAFLLGIAVTIGSVIGGLYMGLTYVTPNKLEGIGVPIDRVLEEDSLLRDLTAIGMVKEALSLSSDLSNASFNSLVAKYGIIVGDGVRKYLPDGLEDLPFSELSGGDAVHVILSHVKFSDVFEISGEFLPAVLSEKISDRTLDLAVEMKLDRLLEGVYLGDAIDIALEVRDDGLAYPVVGEDERPSMVQHLATMNMGEFFAAEDNAGKDKVLNDTLGRIPLSDLMVEEDTLFGDVIAGKKLGDLLVIDNLSPLFSMEPLLGDLHLGQILGYHRVYAEDRVTVLYWADDDGVRAKGLYREIVDIGVNDLDDVDILSRIDNVYVAELMNYELLMDEDGNYVDNEGNLVDEPVFRKGTQENPEYPSGITADIAVLKVGELRDEGTLNEEIRSMQIGTVMGYTADASGVWRDSEGKAVRGVLRPLLASTVGTLNDDMNGLYLGEVMGFDILRNEDNKAVDADGNVIEDEDGKINGTPVFIKDGNNDGLLDDPTYDTPPGALMGAFVSMQLGDIDKEDSFTDRVRNVRVGDAMGYVENENGVWCQKNSSGDLVPVSGLFSSLAGSKVHELDGAVQDLTLADALGYTHENGKWVKDDPNNPGHKLEAAGILQVLMGSTLDSLSEDSKSVYVGQIMGYTLLTDEDGNYVDNEGNPVDEPVFRKGTKENPVYPSGVTAEFVGLTVADFESDSAIAEKIDNMKVGTAMGYTYDGAKWLDKAGKEPAGFMQLIDPNTPIMGLGQTVTDLEKKPIKTFVDAGILKMEQTTIDSLDKFYGFGDGWENTTTLDQFVSKLVGLIEQLNDMIPGV